LHGIVCFSSGRSIVWYISRIRFNSSCKHGYSLTQDDME
jgi:hypothetical protein